MSVSFVDFWAATFFPAAFFVSGRRYRMPVADRNGIVVLLPARNRQPGKHRGRNLEKINGGGGRLAQKRTLKMKLKFRRGTLAPGENDFEMSESLEQRISVRALRRWLLAAEPGAKTIQLPTQFAPQLTDRFQGKRQSQLFSGGFEGKPRQHFYQPLPHQWSGHRVTRQNVGQHNGKSPPATAAPPAIGTKYPPAPDTLAIGLRRIVATKNAVPVQRFNLAAAGAALLFERKSRAFNSSLSRTKWNGIRNIHTCCPNAASLVELFLTALPDGATQFKQVWEKEERRLTALRPHCHHKLIRIYDGSSAQTRHFLWRHCGT
jgi:hypothetical protein